MVLSNKVINGDCLQYLQSTKEYFDTVFMDPPDNIGLGYNGYKDKRSDYSQWLGDVIAHSIAIAAHVWVSFNAKHTVLMGCIVPDLFHVHGLDVEITPCVQTFTFGQNCKTKMGNGHRPLWLFSRAGAVIYPEAIKVPSWRQLNGDKRAAKGGMVPLDVFDFPRVTGNSKQRRKWHPTQLHEGLVERCIKYTTPPGGKVLDPFAGTGTTLRVCAKLGMECVGVEISKEYCDRIEKDLTTGRGTTTIGPTKGVSHVAIL